MFSPELRRTKDLAGRRRGGRHGRHIRHADGRNPSGRRSSPVRMEAPKLCARRDQRARGRGVEAGVDWPWADVPRDLAASDRRLDRRRRSEEHTSELQSLMQISYAVFCLKKKNTRDTKHKNDKRSTLV